MEQAIAAKLFGPGGPMEMTEEVVKFDGGFAPHHNGVKYKVFKSPMPQTLHELFQVPKARGFMKREFLVYEKERYTFEQAYEHAARIGHVLIHEFGVQPGDRVTICSRNCPEYLIAFIAITSVGGVVVPMNSWWTAGELEYGLSNSESKIVFCDSERLNRLVPVLDKLPCVEKVVEIRSSGSQHGKVMAYEDVLALGNGKSMPPFPCTKDENAILMYTSGTTGFPKGVVMTHRGVTHALNGAVALAMMGKALQAVKGKKSKKSDSSSKDDVNPATLLVVPLFHATGLHAVFLVSLLVGRKIVMMYKWNPEEALKLIEKERITQFTGVPTMVLEMMQHPNFEKYDTSSLAAVGGGGAPPPPTMVKDVGKKFKKASPTQGYGMTETNAVVCLNSSEAYIAKPTSCGRPVPGVVVEIWDDNNNKLGPEMPGRVMIKGANIMKEYWRNPEATAKAITPDGFLDSGDIGKLDSDGFLYILDRAKDIVIRGGENISCAEVEAAIYENPHVGEAAVIGVKHPTLQEEVGVAIFPKPGMERHISLDSIRASCECIAHFKRPTHVFLYKEQLPRGATGKILKTEIRKQISEGIIKALPSVSSKL